MINALNALRKDLAGAPIFSERFWEYCSSGYEQGISLAIITERLSGDNLPCEGNSKFSGEVGGSSTLRYIGSK